MKNLYILLFCILPLISCSQGNQKDKTGQPKAAVLKPEDVFTSLKFEVDGKPCLAVINNDYKDFKNKASFPLSLFLTIQTEEKDQDGQPTPQETAAFHQLQSKIINELGAGFTFCHVGTTTMPGYRDIMLYIPANEQDKAAKILTKIKAENKRFDAYTFEPDPEWEAVASFYEAVPAKN